MTFAGRMIGLFPPALAIALVAEVFWFAKDPMSPAAAVFLVTLYLVPPLVYRLHAAIAPIPPGVSRLSDPKYSPWWGSYQIQLLYVAFPSIESFLRLFPGLYSAWLRLWGARVGRGVYWTPRVEIVDRGLVEIGDGVVFGHRSACVSHVIDQAEDGRQVLYVKVVRIGAGAFIGAEAVVGPGCVVEAGARLEARATLKVNERARAPSGSAAGV